MRTPFKGPLESVPTTSEDETSFGRMEGRRLKNLRRFGAHFNEWMSRRRVREALVGSVICKPFDAPPVRF